MKISRRTQRKVLWGYSEYTVLSKQQFGPTGNWTGIFFPSSGVSLVSFHFTQSRLYFTYGHKLEWSQDCDFQSITQSFKQTTFKTGGIGDLNSSLDCVVSEIFTGPSSHGPPLRSTVILSAYRAWAGWCLSLKVQRITEVTDFFFPSSSSVFSSASFITFWYILIIFMESLDIFQLHAVLLSLLFFNCRSKKEGFG